MYHIFSNPPQKPNSRNQETNKTKMSQNQYSSPSQTGYSIYTKNACIYCLMVKDLLKEEDYQIIDCDDYISNPQAKERFLQFIQTITGKSYRTFPMVFKDGVFVGGYTDTKELYQFEKAFDNDAADF